MRRFRFISHVACVIAGAGVISAGCAGGEDAGSAAASGADASPHDAATRADTGASHDASPAVDAEAHDSSAPQDSGVSPLPDTGTPPPADASAPESAAPEAAPPPTALDLHDCTLFDNPANLADWPVTTQITDVEFQYQGSDGVHVEFSKQDGSGSWPDVTPPGWTGSLEYTLGFCENIGGQWYGSAAIQYWRGLPAMGGNVAEDAVSMAQCTAFGEGSTCQVAKNWYYDGRWGNLAGYQPATGEWVGVFVAAGNLRAVTDGSQSPVQERSNVVLVQMPGFAGAQYGF